MLVRVRRAPSLSLPQRLVLVVALAATLFVVAIYLTTIGAGTPADFGWFGYAPLTRTPFDSGGPPAWARLLIWLAFIALWTVASLRLLRSPPAKDSTHLRVTLPPEVDAPNPAPPAH